LTIQRIQIKRDDNPLYHDILVPSARDRPARSGYTSFNVHEEPIVNAPAECIRRSEMAALILS
jgi:predicted NodU family carbamoyl transferase